jgi:low molecular weight protein-tyrosine phosphatase
MSRFALEALQLKAVLPRWCDTIPTAMLVGRLRQGATRHCLKESEHRPMFEQRFPELGDRIIYWEVDDVEFAPPTEALTMIDDLAEKLILTLRRGCAVLRE